MDDNVVSFPGVNGAKKDEDDLTPEKVLEAAEGKYDQLILVGRVKGTLRYECVSTVDIEETLYHITRIHHKINMLLDEI
jgi:hypothetical protein